MSDLYRADFSKLLPSALKRDPKMVTLAKVAASCLSDCSRNIDAVLIYSNFEKLPEELVDILAYDLHAEWYDYGYPLNAKRKIVKESVKIHKRKGTKYAVETALGSLWPESEIEEWFEYGGSPHRFRVVCDVTKSVITASQSEIEKAVNTYKRLSSHMETVVYQARISCVMEIHAGYTRYQVPQTAQIRTGTFPQRNRISRDGKDRVEITTSITMSQYKTEPAGTEKAGTIPKRAIVSAEAKTKLIAETKIQKTKIASKKAGTIPQRNRIGRDGKSRVEIMTSMETGYYSIEAAGTFPQRNRISRDGKDRVEITTSITMSQYKTEPAGTEKAGTIPKRAIVSAEAKTKLIAETKIQKTKTISKKAGTEPSRAIKSGEAKTELIAETKVQESKYNVPKSGTKRKE